VRVLPIGLDRIVARQLRSLVEEAEQPLRFEPPRAVDVRFQEPEWSLMVRVLGQVEVVSCDGEAVTFDRSKALELAVWLSQHRERPTRTAARTALWDLEVRAATFANVVSDARRAMARVAVPAHGEEWIARTLTEELPLHRLVVTDAELLASRVLAARSCPHEVAIEVLRPGLELITGLPFSGTNYLWTDAEGHTSSLVLLATGAAIELAHRYLAVGDVDGVFWATGQGLKVLNGHEELIALRMRAHAQRGDLAGVRHEWESYERALAADPWAAAEPAPKLVALRRELLSPRMRTTA
jgi:two-component SAPR family response regulator